MGVKKPTRGSKKWVLIWECTAEVTATVPDDIETDFVVLGVPLKPTIEEAHLCLVDGTEYVISAIDVPTKTYTLAVAPPTGSVVEFIYPTVAQVALRIQSSFDYSVDTTTEDIAELGTEYIIKETTGKGGSWSFKLIEADDAAGILINKWQDEDTVLLMELQKRTGTAADDSDIFLRRAYLRSGSYPVAAGGMAEQTVDGDFVPPPVLYEHP